jgi:multidrug efflux system membrane fusion protein
MRRVLVLILVLGLAPAACGKKGGAPRAPASVPVEVAVVQRGPVPLELAATGTVEAIKSASVEPQVSGVITKVAFREGNDVQQGQVLFQIDPRPYQAALDQARANLARDRATAVNAQAEAARYAGLVAKEYVTRQQYDQVRATAAAAQATLAASRAAVEEALINVQNATIRAPIAGRTGSLMVREGNLARTGAPMPLVTINQLRPILVRFAVPAGHLGAIQRYRAQGPLPVRVVPTSKATAPATPAAPGVLADTTPAQNQPAGTERDLDADAAEGTLTFIDNAVDTTTGTILLKGLFANQAGTLWPGEFVNVRLQLTRQIALSIPVAALVSSQEGNFLYAINPDGTARREKVVVERTRGNLAVVSGNIQPGERVITDGQLRVRPGAKVQVKDPGPQGSHAIQ